MNPGVSPSWAMAGVSSLLEDQVTANAQLKEIQLLNHGCKFGGLIRSSFSFFFAVARCFFIY